MIAPVTKIAYVKLWDHDVGVVAWDEDRKVGVFEYEPDFLKLGLDISPIHMSLSEASRGNAIFTFPDLAAQTYKGLPGLLADVLPDKFGNSIIDAWLLRQGRVVNDFSSVERLCYTGKRGMGALEFMPTQKEGLDKSVPVEVADLVVLAQKMMTERVNFNANLNNDNAEAMLDILRVGTSAGGARPKAVIAMNDEGSVVSGQTKAPPGYEHWILKFDGVDDLELGAPQGYGRIEYAYYKMAIAAGIEMTESRLLEENGRAHFITRRFDRVDGEKLHMQSLCGIAHYDFNQAGMYGYEHAFAVMRQLKLAKREIIQLYRRMVFNVLARNQDDHTKNITFIMDRQGRWKLSPAYDVTYANDPKNQWIHQHQMNINGKRDHINLNDLIAVGDSIDIKKPIEIIQEVAATIKDWKTYAKEAGMENARIDDIEVHHRSL